MGLLSDPRGSSRRYQKLSPHPNGPSREEVAAHQRRRLLRAVVEAVARDGYDATTVGRLCTMAGVSKRAFYELFMGKPDCFALAYEQIVCRVARQAGSARRGHEVGYEALLATLESMTDAVARAPEQASFVLIHSLDSTPAALKRRVWATGLFEDAVAGCLTAEDAALSPALRRGIVAGVTAVVHARLIGERAGEMPRLARELADWAWCCAGAADAVRELERGRLHLVESSRPASAGEGPPEVSSEQPAECAVRAKSAMRAECASPESSAQRTGARSSSCAPARNERSLLLESAIALAARSGVLAVTPDALAAQSGLSRRRACALFDSPDRCLLEALEEAGYRLLANMVDAGAKATSFPTALRRAVLCLLAELARDPALASAAFVEAPAIGPAATALRVSLCTRAAELLASNLAEHCSRAPSQAACEASVGAVWGLIERHVELGATARLPRLAPAACLMLLAPASRASDGRQGLTTGKRNAGRRLERGLAAPVSVLSGR